MSGGLMAKYAVVVFIALLVKSSSSMATFEDSSKSSNSRASYVQVLEPKSVQNNTLVEVNFNKPLLENERVIDTSRIGIQYKERREF
jgi:hypothetical protein